MIDIQCVTVIMGGREISRPYQKIVSFWVFRRETASGFYPWSNVDSPHKRVAEGIVWLAAWKLVSNDAKRTVAPPNAKHSTPCSKAVFYVFDYIYDSAIMQNRFFVGWGFAMG